MRVVSTTEVLTSSAGYSDFQPVLLKLIELHSFPVKERVIFKMCCASMKLDFLSRKTKFLIGFLKV